MNLLTGNEICEIAVRLEENGEAFYTVAAEQATTPEIKALFEDLAEQEKHHRHVFQQMCRSSVELALTADEWEQFRAYVDALLHQNLFARPASSVSWGAEVRDERDGLRIALASEQETILFFHELRGAIRGTRGQLIERIIQEEKRHIERLTKLLADSGN